MSKKDKPYSVSIKRRLRLVGLFLCIVLMPGFIQANPNNPFYGSSYAVVIGIDNYLSPKWVDLGYASKDARGFARFLKSQGFKVTEVYDQAATGDRIKSEIQKIARSLNISNLTKQFLSGFMIFAEK